MTKEREAERSDATTAGEDQKRAGWRRLALFEPPSQPGRLTDLCIVSLCVQLAFTDSAKSWWTEREFVEGLHDLFRLRFGAAEVHNALNAYGAASFELSVPPGQYLLNNESQHAIEQHLEAARQIEDTVLEEWLDECECFLGATNGERTALRSALLDFNARLLYRYGVSLASTSDDAEGVLTPGCLREIVSQTDGVPPELSQEFEEGALMFWTTSTQRRDSYIAKLMDQAFITASVSVDSACGQLLSRAWGNTVLFLDTNFAFTLLIFDGPLRYHGAASLVELCKQAGIKLVINRATIEELQTALHLRRDTVMRHPIATPRLAALAAECLSEESFERAYNSMFARDRLTFGQFEAYVRNIDEHLRALGIEVDETDIAQLPEYQESSAKHMRILQHERGAEIYDEESESKAEHDFQMWALVQSMRGRSFASYADAPAWLLTYHSRLHIYHEEVRSNRGEAPYFIHPARLFQVLRFIVPRAGDEALAEYFAVVLRSNLTSVRTPARDRVVQRVTHMLSTYVEGRQMPEEQAAELLAKLVVDEALADGLVADPGDEEAYRHLDQSIARAEEASRMAAQEEKQRRLEADRKLIEERSDNVDLSSRVQDLEQSAREDKQDLQDFKADHAGKEAARKQQEQDRRRHDDAKRADLIRFLVSGLLIVVPAMSVVSGALDAVVRPARIETEGLAAAACALAAVPFVLLFRKSRGASRLAWRYIVAALAVLPMLSLVLEPRIAAVYSEFANIGAFLLAMVLALRSGRSMKDAKSVDEKGHT